MKTISQVKLVDNDNIVNVVNRTKAMVGVLKKHAIPMDDDYITVIDTIFSNFKDTSSRVYNIKGNILSLQTKMRDNLKLQTEQFGNLVQNFLTERLMPKKRTKLLRNQRALPKLHSLKRFQLFMPQQSLLMY